MELKPKYRSSGQPKSRSVASVAAKPKRIVSEALEKRVAEIVEQTVKVAPIISIDAVRARMKQVVKFRTYEQPTKVVLATGLPHLNRVLGSEKVGIPYGRMIELSGLEHGGKTLIASILMALGQKDGAVAGYIDVEDSEDAVWLRRLGVDYDNVLFVKTKLVAKQTADDEDKDSKKKKTNAKGVRKSKLKKTDPLRVEGAEEMFEEAEAAMAAYYEAGATKQIWILDSLANLITINQIEAGSAGQTMNTNLDVPRVLARTLPKWAGLAANYNALIIVINQLRNKVGVFFGDPFDTPGGRAARHAFSNRTRVKRLKNGMLRNGQKVVGLVGVLDNIKNKMGMGSVQSEKCGFKISWSKDVIEYRFMTVKEADDVIGGE